MLTKFYLHFDKMTYELQDDDLYNWGDILCSYKRDDYAGIVRTFSSQFYFVNRAKELLMDEYLSKRFNARVNLSVHTLNDRWEYEKRFECPLDFSTCTWEQHIFKINAIDSDLAALIKANKGTKYEFEVGKDIMPSGTLAYDRIPMQESLTFAFTQGKAKEDSADLLVEFVSGELPYVGNVGTEITQNGCLYWNDDQDTDPNSYLLRAVKSCVVNFQFDLEWKMRESEGTSNLYIYIKRGEELIPAIGSSGYIASVGSGSFKRIGDTAYAHPNLLPDPSTVERNESGETYALVGTTVYELKYNGRGYVWESTQKTLSQYFTGNAYGNHTINLRRGDYVVIGHGNDGGKQIVKTMFTNSRFIFTWITRGRSINIDTLRPKTVLSKLLSRISNGANVVADISDYDSRLADTYLMSAESIRGIKGAKLYTSFSDFSEWMSTVFGYVYYIDTEIKYPLYKGWLQCGVWVNDDVEYIDNYYIGNINEENIEYHEGVSRFLYKSADKYFTKWIGYEKYVGANGRPRTDMLFKFTNKGDSKYYCFHEYSSDPLTPAQRIIAQTEFDTSVRTILRFVHRSELLDSTSDVHHIDGCKELKYMIDTSRIYSQVTVGYDKRDYENNNGRYEFNFSNTYTTGCSVTDKKLSLISKYRADCYGIEFAAQKRGEDTSDNTSDQDVFFVLCATTDDGKLIVDRSAIIENTLTDLCFNSAFSPMACIRANAGLIGLQADEVTLTFASSTANSEIVIDGEPMTANIKVDTPIATCAYIEFTSDNVESAEYINGMVEVVSDEVTYRGFIQDLDVKYARPESAKYKLIIKHIEP